MSGDHSYPRHQQQNANSRRNSNENEDTENQANRNDNNYHINNPYSPQGKIPQQQKKHPNPSWQNSNQRNVNNPYSHRTQQSHMQQQSASQFSNSGIGKLSFAIKPGEPLDGRQKQHYHQSIDENERKVGHGSSSHPVLPQTNQQQQQIQEEQQQPDSKVLVEKLQERLDQSNESNFELEASVMALEAELQHTKQALKDQADSERSKLEHELRLAQQESKRWKLLAQQQQQQKGRSIVRDAEFQETSTTIPSAQSTIANTFSNRLLGDSAGLQTSSSKQNKSSFASFSAEDNQQYHSIHRKSFPKNDESHKRYTFSQKEQLGRQNMQVRRLAQSLLEQVEPWSEHVVNSKKAAPSTLEGSRNIKSDVKVSKATVVPMDIETNEKNGSESKSKVDDDSIRRVLLSIASGSNENFDVPLFQYNETGQKSETSSSLTWSEGKLVEWLVVTFSSKSSDRYLSKLLLQSSEARKYVGTNVCWNGFSNREVNGKEGEQQDQHGRSINMLHPLEVRHRRRRSRIRRINAENDTENHATNLSEWQNQARQSLRNSWWTPKDVANPNGFYSTPNDHDFCNTNTKKSISLTQKASSSAFREWVTFLAASWNTRHLHTLRVLLAEEAGKKDFAIDTSDHDSETWWSLCYSSVANTLQRIIIAKLCRSKQKRDKRGLVTAKPTSSRSNFTQRSNASSSGKNWNRRNRIGRFQYRLEKLTEGTRAIGVNEIEEEDKLLSYSLCVWMGLMQVASPDQLEIWYEDRTGLEIGKQDTKELLYGSSKKSCGGLFMVSLLLDLMEELQFDQWSSSDDSMNAMSLSHILSTGVILDERQLKRRKQNENVHSEVATLQGGDTRGWDASKQSSRILPHWYNALIATLTQMGKSRGGMRILRSRVKDYPEKNDWMGNVLDVSVRHLHTLSLHLDDVRTRHGSIVRLDENSIGKDISDHDVFCGGDPFMVTLLRSVEAWVRFWHQVLLFAQSTENISFRALVLDLQDWFTSTCATLLASEEVSREIKAMVRWQLDELMMDEEDFEESRRQLVGRN